MKEIKLTDSNFADSVYNVLCSENPVFILEFTGTFGLVAPNSILGAKALDQAKNRLNGKYYGSVFGNLEMFKKILPSHLKSNTEKILSIFKRAFIRFDTNCKSPTSKVSKDGRHQVLIENLSLRNNIEKVEKLLTNRYSTSDFFIENYQGLLCTSANISGDANGAITNVDQALKFANDRGVQLFVHTDMIILDIGSYPSFYLGKDNITIERKGFRDNEILSEARSKLYGSTDTDLIH